MPIRIVLIIVNTAIIDMTIVCLLVLLFRILNLRGMLMFCICRLSVT